MQEVRHWVDLAASQDPLYTGLVHDHNSNWAQQFTDKAKYVDMLKQAVDELSKTLDSLEPPKLDETLESHLSLGSGDSPVLQKQPSLGRQPSLEKQSSLQKVDSEKKHLKGKL